MRAVNNLTRQKILELCVPSITEQISNHLMACEVGGRKPLEELGKKTDPESWAMYLVQQEVFNADNAERTRLREYASTKNLREIVRQTNCDAKAIEEFLIKEHLWIPEVQPMVQALAEFRDKYGVDYRDAEAE